MKSQGLVREATMAAQVAGKPVVWAADFYGSGCEESMLDLAPDWLTALDQVAFSQVRHRRPDFPIDRIKIIGNPSFDRITRLMAEREGMRRSAFETLGLRADARLLVFSLSDSGQYSADDLWDGLGTLITYADLHHMRLVATCHPADLSKEAIRSDIKRRSRGKAMTPDKVTGDPLADLIVADAAIVQYSQLGVQSSLVVPTLFIMFESMRAYRAKNFGSGWHDKFFPQIKEWVAEVAWNWVEIDPALDRLLGDDEGYHTARKAAAETHFSALMDGGATDRFVEFVLERVRSKK